MLAVQIVTADGKVIVADAKHHPDLYWACRGGGGGNFGIATRFTFRTHAVAQGSYFVATWPWAQAAEVVASFLGWAPHQPDALGALCRLAAGPGGPTVQVFGQFLGSETALKSALASLAAAGGEAHDRHRDLARPRPALGRVPRASAARVRRARAHRVRRGVGLPRQGSDFGAAREVHATSSRRAAHRRVRC